MKFNEKDDVSFLIPKLSNNNIIYFLLLDKEVIYVGMSENGISRPLFTKRTFKFDEIKIIYCEQDKLKETESYYIAMYQPIHNKNISTGDKTKYIKQELKNLGLTYIMINDVRNIIRDSKVKTCYFNDQIYIKDEDCKYVKRLVCKQIINDPYKTISKYSHGCTVDKNFILSNAKQIIRGN